MARQLEARLEELRLERGRLEGSMRRLGEAFASNLDRDALLEIAVRTCIDGVAADGGRASVRHGTGAAHHGDPAGLEGLVGEAEAEALAAGKSREVATDAGSVLTHPLRGAKGDGEVLGLVSVWRRGRPFTERERELFTYLAGQAGVSLENVGLHETVQRQAVTDELTGLFNHRRFQESLANEVERARRFEAGVGLVMLDIDNFKSVNDTYGHQTGDRVLAAVAAVLREQSREIDEPARYGGEELAVVLPGTDLEGAYNLAERVREGSRR
jgi:GGDEF domain-containing protein